MSYWRSIGFQINNKGVSLYTQKMERSFVKIQKWQT